jgi:hypothetical protein
VKRVFQPKHWGRNRLAGSFESDDGFLLALAGQDEPIPGLCAIEIVQQALGHAFQIRFRYCDGELERSAGGKFEEFVCKVVEA